MGLKSGEDGVKQTCKKLFPDCYRDFASLKDARAAMDKKSAETAVFLDGNVLMQAVPAEVWSLKGYLKVFSLSIKQAFDAGDTVFVVFDNNVTKAK